MVMSGGWDFANEPGFHNSISKSDRYLYPWLQRNGFDLPSFLDTTPGINRLTSGQDVFLPTEWLHGLYDGGLWSA